MDLEQPPPEAPAAEPPPRRPHPITNFFVQLFTITVGVLIALFFEGLVEWNQNRSLVREAKATIARELAENKREVDGELNDHLSARARNLERALQMANDLLNTKKSDITQFNLGVSFAELQAASWRTAERTGALGHMDYAEVREYSRVYDFQEVYTAHQRRAVERLSAALSIFASDPHSAPPKDLDAFRQQILALRGEMLIEEQFLRRLSEMYARLLGQPGPEQHGPSNPPAR